MSGGTDAHAPPAPAGPGRVATQPARHGLIGEWPLRDFTELPALPSAVPYARARTRQVLREWGFAGLGDTAGQVVSELVANSVVASQAMRPVCPVRLWLRSDSTRVLVLVADASPRPPARADPGTDAESGRGLLLVEAMSSRWSWYTVQEDGMAKVVWAEFRVPAEDGRARGPGSGLDISPSAPPQGNQYHADIGNLERLKLNGHVSGGFRCHQRPDYFSGHLQLRFMPAREF
jgi:anti-sigma regulatory factor (Ser/Thr protein kinase)